MEALLAMGLISAGSNVLDKVVDTCKTASSSISSASSATFDKLLGSEVSKTKNPYTSMTADELSTARSDLEKKLEDSPEIKAFVGDDKSFTIKPQGSNYIVQRSDGTIWKIPSDSEAAETAKCYCQCRSAQSELDSSSKTGTAGWKITVADK